jgi:flotillin
MLEFSAISIVVLPVAIIAFAVVFVARQYKRCPSNRILVVYGKLAASAAARCLHGGGVLIVPLIQDYSYLSLDPITIEIDLSGALSKKNIRVNVPSTFTVGISTEPVIMNNAAERLLGLGEEQIRDQSRDIILGQLRLVIATLSIEEINQDREKFLELVNQNVTIELNKIGLEVINVNIRDITDESGYIDAIGKRAAAEAINKARVEVAQADKEGAIGESSANREKTVEVADQTTQAKIGEKEAEKNRRITVSQLEADGLSGEAEARRQQEIVVAEQTAKTEQGKKQAEKDQRVYVAAQEADAVQGENEAKARIAMYEADYAEKQAEANRRGEIASANAATDILRAEKDQEVALLQKQTLAKQEVDKMRMEVDAEAQAEMKRRIARGEADAVLQKYQAEAEGLKKVLDAKAEGYRSLLESCGDQRYLAPTLLLVEKLPELIEQQVKAVQNLKIDRVTVWDTPNSGQGTTANFLKSLITSVPAIHDLAKQVGVELPDYFGTLQDGVEAAGARSPSTTGKKSDGGQTADESSS